MKRLYCGPTTVWLMTEFSATKVERRFRTVLGTSRHTVGVSCDDLEKVLRSFGFKIYWPVTTHHIGKLITSPEVKYIIGSNLVVMIISNKRQKTRHAILASRLWFRDNHHWRQERISVHLKGWIVEELFCPCK